MCPDRPGTHTFAPDLRIANRNDLVITNTFVGFQFTMTNIGVAPISDIYLGWFADSDVGPRGGTAIADGMFFQASGYGQGLGMPGNVLFAFEYPAE